MISSDSHTSFADFGFPMAMFARRSIQRFLNELKGKVSLEGRTKLAFEVDRQNASALGYEWELALVYALSQVGSVDYEAELPSGTRRPDISFVSADGSLCFVADVTTISDAGLDEQNPVRRFSRALHRLKNKSGLKGSLNHRVEGQTDGPTYRDRKTRLKLPKISEMDRFLEQHVLPHFQFIVQQNLKVASFKIEAPGVEFTVTYNEDEPYGGMSYPAYTAAQSLKRNPVYTALKLKREQLKKSGADGPFGIFLCDGGCALLSRPGRQQMQVGLDDVVNEFFRQHSSIAFVAVLVFPPSRVQPFEGIIKERRITGQIYQNPRSICSIDVEALLSLINRGLASLPAPLATPLDALHWIARSAPHEGQTTGMFYQRGGGHMSVKMSARKVQELLAGKITAQELFAEYARPGERLDNPFERALNLGFTIEAVKMTKEPDQDDDLIEIAFGFPDPAISKLKVV
jgi:hypothetical protein